MPFLPRCWAVILKEADKYTDRIGTRRADDVLTMVNSRRDEVVADRIDNLTERVQVIEEKIDQLSLTVGQLTSTVGGLFTTVGQLVTTVSQLTTTVGQLAVTMDQRFKAVDEAFVEQREYTEFCFTRLEEKLEAKMDARFGQMDARFEQVDARFEQLDAGVARVERKLDQFIDVQTKTNELVDRRLRALES